MRTVDIVLRLHSSEPKLEIGTDNNYAGFYNELQKEIDNRSADIVYKGDYFRYDQHLLPKDISGFATYALFRGITVNDVDDNTLLWNALSLQLASQRYPEIREKNAHHQLIELSSLEEDLSGSDSPVDNFEEIMVRIPGTREELEFDPSGAEANKILYDKLSQLIYNKEAEVMYKGPKLIFEDNRDLFISPDDFSMYVLFRSGRNYNYESKAELWEHLTNDLKSRSSITLLKSAKNYQVLLFSHDV